MANWKKVVVSGSSPQFSNLQVDGLTADQVVIGGGGTGNLSTTAINGTGNIVATTGASNLVHSGSFSGSFEGAFVGDGSQLTNLNVATNIQRVYYVSPSGNDATGVVGSLSLTFKTISGSVVQAKADAAAGGYDQSTSLIYVNPGTYFEDNIQYNGGNYYLSPGAVIGTSGSSGGNVFNLSDSVTNINVYGQGDVIVSGSGNTGKLIDVTQGGKGDFSFGTVSVHRGHLAFMGSGTGEVILEAQNIIKKDTPSTEDLLSVRDKNRLTVTTQNLILSGAAEASGHFDLRDEAHFTLDAGVITQNDGYGVYIVNSTTAPGTKNENMQVDINANKWILKDTTKAAIAAGNAAGGGHDVNVKADFYLEVSNPPTYTNGFTAGNIYGPLYFGGSNFVSRTGKYSFEGTVYQNTAGSNGAPFLITSHSPSTLNEFYINMDMKISGSTEGIYNDGAEVNFNGTINNASGHGIAVANTTNDLTKLDNANLIVGTGFLAVTGSVASPGKVRIENTLSSNSTLGANLTLTGSGIFTTDALASQIINSSIKSSHNGGSTFTALSANPFTASFGRFEGYDAKLDNNLTVDNSLTVGGSTTLGNDSSVDKVIISASLGVTGSSVFDGTSATVTINPESSDNIITIKNTVDSSTDKIVFLKSDNTEMANLANRGSRSELVLKNNGSDSIKISNLNNSFHEPNLAIGSTSEDTNNTLSVTGNAKITTNLIVGGDLQVAGTASFTHASNLDVADKYILLNSGSTGTSDSGGIVIQGPNQDIGDLFGYRSGSAKSDTQQRWGIVSGFDAKTSTDFTPSAFMAAVVVGTGDDPATAAANYSQAGNIYIDTDAGYEGIWIYS